MSSPTASAERSVSIAFVCSAVRSLDAGQRRVALAEAGIAADALLQPTARVPAAAFARLWLAVAELLDDEFFGLDARRMKVGSFAMLCHSLVAQATVSAALRQAIRGFGLFFDDIGALFMGWSYDDVLPEGTNQALFDVLWVVILGLVGVARWRLRHHPLRRVIDGFWLACVFYQIAVVGYGSHPVGAAGAAVVITAAMLVGLRIWLVSRGAALMLVPLAVFLAYRMTTFL